MMKNKRVLIFPIIGNLIQLCIAAIIAIPLYQTEKIAWTTHYLSTKQYWIFFALMLLLFYLMHFFSLLFKAALTHCAINIIKKQKYNLYEGCKILGSFFFTIFIWNNVMTSVGCCIPIIENLSDEWAHTKIAKNWLSSLTWLTATYFIVPVLLYNNRNPFKAIKHAAKLMKDQWGHVLVSQMNMRVMGWGVHLLSLVPVIIATIIGGKSIIIAGSAITIILFIIISAVNAAVQIMLCAALYLFANGNDISESYDLILLKNAFKKRL